MSVALEDLLALRASELAAARDAGHGTADGGIDEVTACPSRLDGYGGNLRGGDAHYEVSKEDFSLLSKRYGE